MTKTPVRARARALAILVPFLCVLGVGAGCTEQQRSNGQSCLKSDDCLSGVCANFTCVAAAPLLDAEVSGDGSLEGSSEAGGDGTTEASPPKDSGKETAPPMEAATESGSGSGGEAGTDGSTD